MIKKVKSNEINVNFVIESYNSSIDVVKDCKTRKITDSSFKNMQAKGKVESDSEWYGVDSYEQALQFLEEGYQPTVEKLKAGIKANLQGQGKRISFHNDIVGYAPIVPLAVLGVPNSMINSRMKPIKAKVIDVYYNMTASCGTDSDDIIQAGIKEVIYKEDKYANTDNVIVSKSMFDSCGVKYTEYKSSGKKITLEL